MSYIGRGLQSGAFRQLDDISSGFDGSDTTHTMQVNSANVTVGDVNQILLSLGGVIQKPGTDFTVSGSVLTFTTAPAANTSFFAILLGSDNGGTVTPTDGSVTSDKLASTVLTGATDIGGALADADLFLVDDGAGGTLRKVAASRVKTYAGTDLDAAVTINDSGAAVDFRVEGDTKQNLLFVDGSADRVGINTSAPDMLLDVTGTVTAGAGSDEKLQQWNIDSDNVKAEIEYLDTSSERGYAIGTSSQHHFMLRTNDAIRIKINETGGLTFTNPLASVYAIDNQLTVGSGNVYGQKNTFENHSPDNNTSSFYWGNDNVTARFGVYSDGDVLNHDNSYGAFSDERIKQDIRDSNSQWDDIKAVKVRNFKKKDDVRQYGDKAWEQIGVIAQELEAAGMDKLIKHGDPSAADIISSSEFGTLNEDGTIKEIKTQVKKVGYSVLYMKAIKALQEAMAKIETLEADVKTLKGE
jgi:hypothetical protein